jgi:hypothetical protein
MAKKTVTGHSNSVAEKVSPGEDGEDERTGGDGKGGRIFGMSFEEFSETAKVLRDQKEHNHKASKKSFMETFKDGSDLVLQHLKRNQ